MKVAIYARYSSENQSEKSIDDQIRVCKRYIQEQGMIFDEKHVYVDEAISGSVLNRPGLQALERAAEHKEFEAVAVDDLSRLSRSNHQMLTLVMKFNYLQIKMISVSDGIITDDDNAKLGIHIRGFINELYLDDLKKKTMRGLEGQKIRGFSTGENVYGYRTQPVGELRLNRKGKAKYDGMVHCIDADEANIVCRIYTEFIGGSSIHKISIRLNSDKVPTKKGLTGGWNVSTVSRILKNEKYTGQWIWRKWKNVRDPLSGKIKKVIRPEKEQVKYFREELVIIDTEIWDKAQQRWQELQGAWPVSNKQKSHIQQKSYVHSNPTHLLAGLLKCEACGGALVLISGKGSGYYGCYNAKRKTCNNRLLISRKRVESNIIAELRDRILTAENLSYVYKKLEQAIAKRVDTNPEQLKKKKSQQEKLLVEIQNYLNFIKSGNFSKAVSTALQDAEAKSDTLKQEMESLEFQRKHTFQAPPREWIDHRLERLHETLGGNTTASALALKDLLGPVRMEPISDREADVYALMQENGYTFKPYYVAHTKINTLALLDDRSKGANWYQWRRR